MNNIAYITQIDRQPIIALNMEAIPNYLDMSTAHLPALLKTGRAL